LKEKLIKIGVKVVSQGRYAAFQMAGAAIPRYLLPNPAADAELRPPPAAASA
jgi:hypothetical protein